jgi:putative membrane protein
MSEDNAARIEQQPEDPRVRFAAERTLLAWMRTGLALMGGVETGTQLVLAT